jgi:hypothetical protein
MIKIFHLLPYKQTENQFYLCSKFLFYFFETQYFKMTLAFYAREILVNIQKKAHGKKSIQSGFMKYEKKR